MKALSLTGDAVGWAGCVDIEQQDASVTPWRGLLRDRKLYDAGLIDKLITPAGVRIVLISDTSRLAVKLAKPCFIGDPAYFDLVVDGQLHHRLVLYETAESLDFEDIPGGSHVLELYMPLFALVTVAA